MGFMLLWFEHLALGLSLMALGVALTLRAPWVTLRCFATAALIGLPLGATVAIAVFEIWLVRQMRVALSTHGGAPAAAVVLLLGLGVLAARGLGRGEGGRRRALDWSLPQLCLAVIASTVLYSMTFWNLDLSVRQQMESMRREAATLALSVAPPRTSDRENAALSYQQLFEAGLAQKKPEKYEEWWNKVTDNESDFDARDPELVAYVQRNRQLVDALRDATKLPACSFTRDWSRLDINMLLVETQNARGAARDLALEARVEAGRGNLRLAIEDLAAIHRLSEHIGQEPLLVSQLVSFAIDSISDHQLEWMLQHCRVTEEDLAPLANVPLLSLTPRLQRAALAEEALGLATMSDFDDSGVNGRNLESLGATNWGPNMNPLYRVFFYSADMQMYRRFLYDWRATAHQPYAERLKAYGSLEASLKSTPVGIVTRLLVPAQMQFDRAVARTSARQRLAYLAVAAHRYRLKHGGGRRFPDDLDQLAAFGLAYIPVDPFDDKPLRMMRRGDEVVLYSIGPDLVDDQGAKFDFATSKGDYAFVLKLPPE